MSGFHKMYGAGKEADRNPNDCYPTPPYATYALGKYVDVVDKVVYEPAAGRGWMARELALMGAVSLASDLHAYPDCLYPVTAGVDFLNMTPFSNEEVIVVTNPPYGKNMAEKFVRHSIAMRAKTTAMLLRLTFMESRRRLKLFTEHPPALILPFSCRFSCNESTFENNPFGGQVAYAWYVWERGRINTQVKWIDSEAVYAEWKEKRSDAKDDRREHSLQGELRP